MTQAETQLSFEQDSFDAFVADRAEPDWIVDQRRAAWQQFSEMDWPSRRSEEWQRTDIRMFKLDKFQLPNGESTELDLPAPMLGAGVELAGQVRSVNGLALESELADECREKGVIFTSLDQALRDQPDWLSNHLFKASIPASYDRFAALHQACWTASQVLYVPRNVSIANPFLIQSLIGDGGSDFGHTLVVLDEGAEATLLAETASLGSGDGLHCGGIEISLGARSHLRYVNLQDWNDRTWHFAHQQATIGQDANLQWTVGALGARLAKVNQSVVLDAPGADCQVNGVMFTEDKQHFAYHTLQHHKAHSCHSDFLYKAALQDKSRTVWRGMIKVDKPAQKTDGYQRNDNLLLSSQARADAIPGLEIEADDVRCTHGSTTGRVDEELIFYAQCRGFTRREAIRAIVTGFFQQVFDRITIDSVRDALGEAIARRVRDY